MELTNFDYQITNLKQKGKKNIKVTFDYLNHKVTYELLLKENDKYKENDYLNEAKEIINQEVKSGKLEKYADKYLKKHNIKLPLFTDFEYSLVPSSLKGYKEVQVMFNYQNQRITTYAFIKETANKGKEYYLNEAKKQINAETRDGRLLKEVKKFINPKSGGGSSKGAKVALACVSVAALALGGLFVYELLKKPTDYTITVDPNGGKLNDEGNTAGVKTYKVKPQSTWKELGIKVQINPSGASWLGWTYNVEGAEEWKNIGREDDFTFTGNTTVKANFDLSGEMLKVTVDNKGGTWDPSLGYGDDNVVTKEYEAGKVWGEIKDDFKISKVPEGMQDNYTYQYYNTAKEGSDKWEDLGEGTQFSSHEVLVRILYRDIEHALTIQDPFSGLRDDAPEIQNPPIKANETWGEYRTKIPTKSEIQELCKPGYTFAGYYRQLDGGGYIEIPDTYKFTSDNSICLLYYVHVNFKNKEGEEDYGRLPHVTASILTGTKWQDIKTEYMPPLGGDWIFQWFNDQNENKVDDDYEFTSTVTLTATYEAKPADSFADDTWPVFLNELSKHQTVTSLGGDGQPYHDEYISSEGKEANSFVGLTRDIEIGGLTYTVRVVDEHDRAMPYDSNSLLTFEVTETMYLDTKYNDSDNFFDDSELSKYLNDNLIYGFPSEVVDAMKAKKVKYYKHNDDPTSGEVVETANAVKLYPLSAYEMGFTTYPEDESGTANPVKYEGERSLKYYDSSLDEDILKTRRQKKRIGGDANVSYWLRSADIVNPDCVWFINNLGTMGEHDEDLQIYCSANYQSSLAVAPAFEI